MTTTAPQAGTVDTRGGERGSLFLRLIRRPAASLR